MFEKKNIDKELKTLEESLEKETNWDDYEKINKNLKKKNYLSNFIKSLNNLEQNFLDTIELIEITDETNNPKLFGELEGELKLIEKRISILYLETLMSGKADNKNVLVEIHSGAGGVESQDWVEMLLRMYSRWAESKNFSLSLVDQSIGEEAGLKSVTIRIEGENAYGWLKLESGVHRLVRISPFDSQSRRHTSFASVFCYPEVDNTVNINIAEKDLRIDTYRASGAGGQHVNKTDSAVRITHLPSNISVQCQSSRSQHRNKTMAMEMLKSKIYDIELKKEDEENKKSRSEKGDISWGNQIRSYVMQPYTMVKDHRTNTEISDVSSVLDGNIEKFLESQLTKFS
ncbi:MAG: peptide chain release factor 2 [Alphaproteobacteria bacterium]|nr:peptide chain release factor 2 [Alphaproteobacteria bacterium]